MDWNTGLSPLSSSRQAVIGTQVNVTLRPEIPEEIIFDGSEAMLQLRDRISKVAATSVPVLITGESGTGKGVMANLIHRQSPRWNAPFVKVSCPAVPEPLIESELFGYEKGAFTGAYERKTGLVEFAEGGTLFLDEIGELAPGLQAKLLHLLQDGTFMRIGGCEEKQGDTRIICATNRKLNEELRSGSFRADLYYRLNVVGLEIPPLRERREAIPAMTRNFLNRYRKEYNSQAPEISSGLMQLFTQYDWPGNVRELENVVRRYVILGSEEATAAELLGGERKHLSGSKSLKTLTREAIQELERKIILEVLYATNWNRRETARILKISYRALFYKLKNAGVPQKRNAQSSRTTEA